MSTLLVHFLNVPFRTVHLRKKSRKTINAWTYLIIEWESLGSETFLVYGNRLAISIQS